MAIPNFTGTYVPPGTYLGAVSTPIVPVVGVQPDLIAIYGPSIGYETSFDSPTLTGTTPVQLTQLGISPTSVVVTSLDGLTTYAVTTDYVLAVGGGADGSTLTLPDNTLTIARASSSTIPTGTQVVVSYQFTDAGYFVPQTFTDYKGVVDAFGPSFNPTTGAILSPLSLAAQVAFQEGAGQVVLAATTDASPSVTTRANLATALNNLSVVQGITLVVPLPVGLTGTPGAPGDINNVAQDLRGWVDARYTQYNSGAMGIVGYETTSTVTPLVTANAVNDRRMIVAWPNQIQIYNGSAPATSGNQLQVIGGYYLAAAYAGSLASRPVEVPLTKKLIRSFNGFPGPMFATMTNSLKNSYSAGGVSVCELNNNKTMTVRHGVTTATDTLVDKEISIVRAEDELEQLFIEAIDQAQLIGSFIDVNTLSQVQSIAFSVLNTAMNQSVILQYQHVTVTENSINPSIVGISFEYLPAIPLNYITISYNLNLSMGLVNANNVNNTVAGTTPNTPGA